MKKTVILSFCMILASYIHAQTGSTESLVKLAQKVRPDFYLGSAASGISPSGADSKQLMEFFRNNFNIMTAGIYMTGTQREQGKYNFATIDYLVDFAKANNIKVYFHPLIGGAVYTATWINKGNFTKEELEKIMRDRITTVLTRYGNRVQYVDVVNEAFAAGADGLTPEGDFNWRTTDRIGEHMWLKTMGMYQGKKYKFPQYLVDAFRIAREVGDKNLKLNLNETGNATTKSPRGTAFFALIKAMREEGIPVDGAGIQLHCNIKDGKFYETGKLPFDFDAFDAMLKQYEQAGIDVHITEFDIHLPQNPTEADFQLQGKYYAEILKHAIKSPAVKTFKTWGFTDKYSWKPNNVDGHPLLLDESFKPKPAYIQQVEMLKSLAGVKK